MKPLVMFENGYKTATATAKAVPEFKAWQGEWLSKFQTNPHKGQWSDIAEKLLDACTNGKEALVRECFWASLMGAECDPLSLPAIVAWGMKRAVSVGHIQDMYELMSVKLSVSDIQGESFYAGFPNPTETDLALGRIMNEWEL